MLRVFTENYISVVVDVEEIAVIWEPANCEDEDDEDEHLDYLKEFVHY
mgnify:CR=1 FL=1